MSKVSVNGRRVFLSGPMSSMRNYNVGAFVDAHAILKELGAKEVYDPAIEYLRQDGEAHGHEWYMARCLHELTRHTESRATIFGENSVPPYDLLVQLPGWEDSEGALTEFSVAKACGIECCTLSELVDDDELVLG